MPAPLIDRRKVAILAKGVAGRARRGLRRPQMPFPYSAPPVPATVDPPEHNSNIGANYETEWARRPSARVARSAIVEGVLRPSVAAFGQPDRSGYDRLLELDTDQNAIFVANHHSHLDTSLLLTSIPNPWRHRLVVGAASEVFFNTRFKAMLSALSIGAFPIDRSTMGRAAADQAAELIDAGNSLLIFPEGGRSKDGWGQPFRGGAAYLALRCDVPVVPIYLAGTAKVWRKGQRLPRPARTAVLFGDPMWATEGENTRRFNARIEAAVSSLGDEMATDWWQARLRHYRKDTPSLEGPQASSWRRAWALGATTKRRSRNSSWPN